MRHDHVHGRKDRDELPVHPFRRIRAFELLGILLVRKQPPQNTVAAMDVAFQRRNDRCAARNPFLRNELFAVPTAFPEHQLPEPRHVARGEMHVVGEMFRHLRVARQLVARTVEILHAQRLRQIALQRVENVQPRLLRENRSRDIEVPIVVNKSRAVGRRSSLVFLAFGDAPRIRRGMIDARTRRD